ncbi:hypothetical protein M406DRAFT_66667 [Cryphonectria parasitica EP155]|uniref:Uncharacterized protein n=1 Tax=Cryphonectria parasitica (strain ATCC 38755 / EP155) TaxID=660469 RepID=A0A9P4YC24_CRYP1|nr:uncharacterized protein M406DRAFT_66667 [Cryphonectria parasitica EP155]KAF3770249.1 hypothetical protein M406DRAFT_66667 [Cryphonectria parasitica EP155]
MIRAPGTRSLMAMCLRKVPDYIGELEDWEERQAEEEGTKSSLRVSDVSNEVYGAVEQLLRPGHGCPQLRIVARAHGMKVVKDALLDGLLEDGFSHLLVQLCANMKASLEVEELLAIIVDRQYPKPKGIGSTFDESRRLAPLKALRNFVQGSGRSQYMLRQLSDLLSRQQLPLSWLSTAEFSSIWSGIINTLSSGNQVCDDTVSFATHMITTLASQAKMIAFILRPEANDLKSLSQQTLLSATTAMASLPLLHQEAGNISQHITGQNSLSTISRRVGHVIHACIYELRRARKSGWITTVLRLAAYFTSNAHDGSKYTDIPELWNRIIQGHAKRDGKQHYEAAIALICSIAQCCGRGVSDPSHHYLIRLCDRLDKAAELEAGMSRSLRINCAFLLAERTNDLRDLAFAESFDLRRASQHKPSSLSSPSLLVTGFRWDEGISEWVTETPAVRKRFSRQFSMEMTSSDSNVETRRRNVDDATDGDPHSSPLGRDFKDNPSTNQSGLYRMEPRQTRATARAGNSVRQSTIEQQYLMRGWKRGAAMAGLLSLQSDDDDLEDQCEDQVAGRQKESSTSRQQQQQQQRRCSSGKENTNTVPGEGRPPPPKRRRRVSALRPRQSVLTNITNVGPDEESSDELGL